eukprot:Opistho-2@54717
MASMRVVVAVVVVLAACSLNAQAQFVELFDNTTLYDRLWSAVPLASSNDATINAAGRLCGLDHEVRVLNVPFDLQPTPVVASSRFVSSGLDNDELFIGVSLTDPKAFAGSLTSLVGGCTMNKNSAGNPVCGLMFLNPVTQQKYLGDGVVLPPNVTVEVRLSIFNNGTYKVAVALNGSANDAASFSIINFRLPSSFRFSLIVGRGRYNQSLCATNFIVRSNGSALHESNTFSPNIWVSPRSAALPVFMYDKPYFTSPSNRVCGDAYTAVILAQPFQQSNNPVLNTTLSFSFDDLSTFVAGITLFNSDRTVTVTFGCGQTQINSTTVSPYCAISAADAKTNFVFPFSSVSARLNATILALYDTNNGRAKIWLYSGDLLVGWVETFTKIAPVYAGFQVGDVTDKKFTCATRFSSTWAVATGTIGVPSSGVPPPPASSGIPPFNPSSGVPPAPASSGIPPFNPSSGVPPAPASS